MKAILVSGANKGIGLAIVEAILSEQESYSVLLGSRDLSRGNTTREQLLSNNIEWADRLYLVQIDVTDEGSVTQSAASVSEILRSRNGELCAVVNNAGTVSGTRADMLAVNVYGVQNVIESFLPLLNASGRIVNVTSASGPNYVADCASDWQQFFLDKNMSWPALHEFMQDCIACDDNELAAKGLRVGYDYGLSKACANLLTLIAARENPERCINACTPGFIDTDLSQELIKGSGKSAADLGMKTPAEGARVVMHLLFDELETTGFYYGSDAQRSPMDRYRAPGSPPYSERKP